MSKTTNLNETTYSTPQDASLIPTIGVTMWLGWNGILVYLLFYLIFFATSFQRIVILGLLTTSLLLPPSFPGTLGTIIGNFILFQAQKYFGLKITYEDEESIRSIPKTIGKTPIFACEPHDVLPYNVFCFGRCLELIPGDVGKEANVLVTDAISKIPIMRQVYSWVGTIPVDKRTFRNRLKNNQMVAFIPGGVQEVTMLNPERPQELVLYLNKRKGFIKLALEGGHPIIPVFCFNLDGSYGYYFPRGVFFQQIARNIGFLPMILWGRFGIPMGIPRPQKLHTIFGKPIEIPCEGGNVKDESVDKYHAIFLKEMEALFERHKHAEGYGNRSLKIL